MAIGAFSLGHFWYIDNIHFQPDEVKENLKRRLHNVWAVNVLSATTGGKCIPLAIKLTNNGCPAYVTRAKLRGKAWMRLRVVFSETGPRPIWRERR